MTLFWHPTGPKLSYEYECFTIEDLNPEMRVRWRIKRWTLFKIGVNCMLAAILGTRGAP